MAKIDQDTLKILDTRRNGNADYEMDVEWITSSGEYKGLFTLSWPTAETIVELANSQTFDDLTLVIAQSLVNANGTIKNGVFDALQGKIVQISVTARVIGNV